ncbi:MAG: hypothetical protein HY321_09705 [Armatimonadetes bacterium]|nr:hypothetical protein [Armatimonadota bacterium]
MDDVGQVAAPDIGTRDDPAKVVERVVQVIRLDKVRLYFSHGSSAPDDAYPDTGSQFHTRAVVWATCTSQNAYCGVLFDENRTWWTTGLEGPLSEPDPPPPSPGTFTGTVMDQWPSNWPPVTVVWTRLKHVASAADGSHNRIYSYDEYPYLTGWGEDNRTYSTPGIRRLRATATMDAEEPWVQSKVSTDLNGDGAPDGNEWALRICCKDPTIYVEPDPPPANSAQRRDYVEWLSTYDWEPYEWGGEGYGGRDRGGQYAGGAATYDGYGIDCSGLVCCGAYRAGYNWSPWRTGTVGLASSDYSEAVSAEEFAPGDILVHPGVHVLTFAHWIGDPVDDIWIIHASGTAARVIQEASTISQWTSSGFLRRRLRQR